MPVKWEAEEIPGISSDSIPIKSLESSASPAVSAIVLSSRVPAGNSEIPLEEEWGVDKNQEPLSIFLLLSFRSVAFCQGIWRYLISLPFSDTVPQLQMLGDGIFGRTWMM